MRHHVIQTATLATALLLSTNFAYSTEKKAEAPGATATSVKAGEKSAGDKKPAASAKSQTTAPVKLVNINSASKAELMTLPGVSDALADKIIGGRPYNTKAHLVEKKIMPVETWDTLAGLITAKQK